MRKQKGGGELKKRGGVKKENLKNFEKRGG
jgi:hypothetical protein